MTLKAKGPRLSQEQRSDATRERLIKATIDCIVEKGYVGATTAEINALAGVSNGARVHHFKSKMDLIAAVVAFIYEQATLDSLDAASAPTALSDPLAAFMQDTYRLYSGGRYLVQHELVNAARTSEELSQTMLSAANAFRAAVTEAWLQTFQRAGHSASWSERAMELTTVIMRGLAVGSLLRGRDRDAKVLRIWREVMSRYPDERPRAGK